MAARGMTGTRVNKHMILGILHDVLAAQPDKRERLTLALVLRMALSLGDEPRAWLRRQLEGLDGGGR
jgi:hypothetical protein